MVKVPGLSQKEIVETFAKPAYVAKIATFSQNGTIRITSIWYEFQDSYILMNTFENSDLVRNLRRDERSSMTIDTPNWPYKGVHWIGACEVDKKYSNAQEIGKMFARYVGNEKDATKYGEKLIGWGKRVFVRFYPKKTKTWDFTKG